MRAIAGALVVIAGSALWGVGAATMTFAVVHYAWRDYGQWATIAGVILVVAGLAIIAIDLLSGKPPDRPGQPPGPE